MKEVFVVYCGDSNGSWVVSIHKTFEGAKKALELDKDRVKKSFDIDYPDGIGEYAWDYDLFWSIAKTELLD